MRTEYRTGKSDSPRQAVFKLTHRKTRCNRFSLATELQESNDVLEVPALNQKDGIHPNAGGYRLILENIWPTLEPLPM